MLLTVQCCCISFRDREKADFVWVQVMLFGQAMLPILSGVLSERHLDMPLPQLCQVGFSGPSWICSICIHHAGTLVLGSHFILVVQELGAQEV